MSLLNQAIPEGRMIRCKLAAYGYERGRMPMDYTSILEKIHALLNVGNVANASTNIVGFKSAIGNISMKSKEILESYFNIHNIPYLSIQEFVSIANDTFPNQNISTDLIDEFYKFYDTVKNSSEMISPFSLPINLVDGHSMIGDIQKPILFIPDVSVMEKTPIVFSGVNLGGNDSLLSVATLGHEVIHSQLESVKGSCKDYYNKEVVPIFVEKLMAKDLDSSGRLLKKSEEIRACWLRSRLDIILQGESYHTKEELLEATVYVHSTIKADHLFDKYINGDVDTQSQILDGIQKIFDGESTVEDMLSTNDITYSNSSNLALIKKRSAL